MRHYFLFALLAFTVVGCKPSANEHLPPAKMEQVMYDISIAETYSSQNKDNTHIGGSKNIDSLGAYYKEIFAHYNITQEEFTKSLKWYKYHPDDLDSLYTHMSAKAEKQQAEEAKRLKK